MDFPYREPGEIEADWNQALGWRRGSESNRRIRALQTLTTRSAERPYADSSDDLSVLKVFAFGFGPEVGVAFAFKVPPKQGQLDLPNRQSEEPPAQTARPRTRLLSLVSQERIANWPSPCAPFSLGCIRLRRRDMPTSENDASKVDVRAYGARKWSWPVDAAQTMDAVPSLRAAHAHPRAGDRGDGPRAAGAGTVSRHRAARSALCHQTGHLGVIARRNTATGVQAARRIPARWPSAAVPGFMAHQEAALPPGPCASPSARWRSRRRTAGGGTAAGIGLRKRVMATLARGLRASEGDRPAQPRDRRAGTRRRVGASAKVRARVKAN
jgi:hypothetical protein